MHLAKQNASSTPSGTLWAYDTDGLLTPVTLQGEAVDLTARPPRVLAEPLTAGAVPAVLLVPARRGAPPPWVVIVRDSVPVRVNGAQLAAGIRVLADRDEIRVAGGPPVYFSAETLPYVEPYPGERPVRCPRCHLPIEPGKASVRCPSCGVYQHEVEGRRCTSYAPSCAACRAPLELGGGYRWVPEEP